MSGGGSKPGERRGGRRPGSANRKSREIADRAVKQGITPLEYMLDILRDQTNDQALRFEAAKAAAPYIHPRLSSVEARNTVDMTVKGGVDAPERPETPEEWLARRNRELQAMGTATGATTGRH